MALVLENEVYALGSGTIAHASGAQVRVSSGTQQRAVFEVEHGAWWLRVSPDGRSVLVYEAGVPRVWRWRENHGVDLWAFSKHTRDSYGCGFLQTQEGLLTLLAQDGSLRGFTDSGEKRFEANLLSPASYYPRSFVPLPGERLALVGHFFGDSNDSIVAVNIPDLLRHPEAVQDAIRNGKSIMDRAIEVTVGACGGDSAVIYRNPQQEEEEPDEEAAEDIDVYGFTGIYVRNLESGAIVARHAWSGSATSYSSLISANRWIAIEVKGGLVMIEHSSGHTRHVPMAALDPIVGEAIIVNKAGGSQPMPLDRLLDSEETQIGS